MSKYTWIILILISIGFCWNWRPDWIPGQSRPPERSGRLSESTHHEASSPSSKPLESSIKITPKPPVEILQKASPYQTPPIDNVIEFKIIDGFGVAYGDVLLGKPNGAVPGDRGRYQAPMPQLWESRNIPYMIHSELPNPDRVQRALEYLRQKTRVNFIPYQGLQPDFIVFEPGNHHCLSYLGKVGGAQSIRLANDCGTQEVLHEILHSLGFVHEQSRSDRDQAVEILWDHIEEKYQDQFAKVPENFLEPIRQSPFDFHSIMLYRPDLFVIKPGSVNMRPKGMNGIDPVAEGLSEEDIRRIHFLFQGKD